MRDFPAAQVQRVQDRLLIEFREAWHDRPVDDPVIWRRLALAALEEAEKGGGGIRCHFPLQTCPMGKDGEELQVCTSDRACKFATKED